MDSRDQMTHEFTGKELAPKRLVAFDGKIEDILEVFRSKEWLWALNARCKYIRIYVIHGYLYVTDRFRCPVSLDDIKRQTNLIMRKTDEDETDIDWSKKEGIVVRPIDRAYTTIRNFLRSKKKNSSNPS